MPASHGQTAGRARPSAHRAFEAWGARRRVCFDVGAPSKAWRFLRGVSPRGVRTSHPPLPSVAWKRVTVTRSVHREPYRPQGRPHSLKHIEPRKRASLKEEHAGGDAFNVVEANNTCAIWQGQVESAGVREHGMYGEKRQELGRPCLLLL